MRNLLNVSIALLVVICVSVSSSFSHDAVVAYDNAKDYLYFVLDGTVYRGDLTTNTISEVFVNDATDGTLIQLFPNGDGILVRGPETFKLITLPDKRIIYEGKNNYTQQPFSPSGRYFAYNNPDKGQVLRIDLKTGNEDVWVENVHPTLEFFYGWDDESIFEFFGKDAEDRKRELYYRCWKENTIVKEEMIYFYAKSYSTFGSEHLAMYVASKIGDFINVMDIYEHYVSKTGLFLRRVGGWGLLSYFIPDMYFSSAGDYYIVANDSQKVILYTTNAYEYSYIQPYIKVFDLYNNYSISYWMLNDQYDADVLKYRGLNQCQFDIASQNMIVWDRIDQSLYRISWFSTNELKINREVDIQFLDKQPTIVISKVNNFIQL